MVAGLAALAAAELGRLYIHEMHRALRCSGKGRYLVSHHMEKAGWIKRQHSGFWAITDEGRRTLAEVGEHHA